MAAFLIVGLLVGLLLIEQEGDFCLFGGFLLCLSCSAGLMFCLIKLGVMDFPEASFWGQLASRLSQSSSGQAMHRCSLSKQACGCSSTLMLHSGTNSRVLFRRAA